MVGYASALHSGRTEAAFALLSSRCQKVFGQAQFSSVVQRATGRLGGATPQVGTVRSTVVGDRAFVSYTVSGGGTTFSPSDEPWVRQISGWRMDGCN